jgi:hypothetical protein
MMNPKFLSYVALDSDGHRFLSCCVLGGHKRWMHGDPIKQIEEEEDRSAVRRVLDDA